MTADGAERLLSAIGPNRLLEKGIRVKTLPGAPDSPRSRQDKPDFEKKRPPGPTSERERKEFKPKRKFDGQPSVARDAHPDTRGEKPWGKKKGKPEPQKAGDVKPGAKRNNAKKRQP